MSQAVVGNAKQSVKDFWEAASCGELLYLPTSDSSGYAAQAKRRYELEPCIDELARFATTRGQKVLEIGTGLGADHQRFAEAGAILSGIDLTDRAVEHTRRRLSAAGLSSDLRAGDAENLEYPDETFDIVFSWGVLHHSPDTAKAIREVYRVLKTGGQARVMIYHRWSLVGMMLWVRYALLGLRPWRGLREIYSHHLESPGTKAYSLTEARLMFEDFRQVDVRVRLSHADLLDSGAGQRHSGPLLSTARQLFPRKLLRRFAKGLGLFMLIEATK